MLDHTLGKTVTFYAASGNINGVMDDISNKGELILLCEDNQKKRFLSGELSIRLAKDQSKTQCIRQNTFKD